MAASPALQAEMSAMLIEQLVWRYGAFLILDCGDLHLRHAAYVPLRVYQMVNANRGPITAMLLRRMEEGW